MKNPWNQKLLLSPSLITLDMTDLKSQVRALEKCGIEMLHIDILDGHFSPSMPLGLETVRQLRAETDLAFDCHVMTTAPEFFINELLDIGVQQIVFQAETEPHIDGMLKRIHAAGVRAGVALKPATPLSVLDYVLGDCDCVLLMLINPGYAQMKNERQVSYADRKIRELRRRIAESGSKTMIEIDGRISPENIRKYGDGAVEIYVCGSTCLDRRDISGSVEKLRGLTERT